MGEILTKLERFLKEISLNNRQRKINKDYEKNGLTDSVLEAQVQVNTERHELDIPDKTELNSDGFSQ